MKNITRFRLINFFLFLGILLNAQIKQEILTLGKENKPKIEVKKIEKKKTNPERYPPEIITNNSQDIHKKDSLNYVNLDIPAVSDFETSSIPPQELKTDFSEKNYSNYVKTGYGNFGTFLLDAYASYPIQNHKNRIGGSLSHLSTNGFSNSDYPWSTGSSKTTAEGFYNLDLKNGKLDFAANYTFNKIQYYGLDIPSIWATEEMDIAQKMNQIGIKSHYDMYANNYLDNITLSANYWWDRFNTKESNIKIKARLAKSGNETSLFMMDNLKFGVEADVLLNYTDTQFGILTKNNFSYFTTGFNPVLTIGNGLSYLKIGGNIMYNLETNSNNSKFYFYPKAEFNFHTTKELVIYLGIDGGLENHAFSELTQENPYLLSNQQLIPTNTLYKAYGGIRGNVGKNIKYHAEASFSKAENLLFYYRNNEADYTLSNLNQYNRLNTLSALYDDGTITQINTDVHYFWNENLSLTGDFTFKHYSLENLDHAWHQPSISGSLSASYKILDGRMQLGSKVFFVGNRKSNQYNVDATLLFPQNITENNTTLDSYIDFNLSASYQILSNLSVFLNGNNLFNKNYEQFEAYKVLGFQILGGIIFKF